MPLLLGWKVRKEHLSLNICMNHEHAAAPGRGKILSPSHILSHDVYKFNSYICKKRFLSGLELRG